MQRVGLKDGMTISFHHGYREGDRTINAVVQVLADMGFKNLTLATSSLMSCNTPLIAHIKSGVIRRRLHLRACAANWPRRFPTD